MREREEKVVGAEAVGGGGALGWMWAEHLDRKRRGEAQELEVSLTERKGVAEVPGPLTFN